MVFTVTPMTVTILHISKEKYHHCCRSSSNVCAPLFYISIFKYGSIIRFTLEHPTTFLATKEFTTEFCFPEKNDTTRYWFSCRHGVG